MAIFRTLNLLKLPVSILETPGKLYIEGQAHDATTLTPLFNDTLTHPTHARVPSTVSKQSLPIVMMGNRFAQTCVGAAPVAGSGVSDFTALDCNQDILKAVAPMSHRENSVFVPSGDIFHTSPYPGFFVDNSNGTKTSQYGSATANTNDGIGFVAYEGPDDFITVTAISSTTAAPSSSNKGYAINRVNKVSGAAVALYSTSQNSSSVALIHQNDNFLFFGGFVSNGTATDTNTHNWLPVSKSSMSATQAPNKSFNAVLGLPKYKSKPSKAIPTGDGKMVYFNAYTNSNSGNLFKFGAFVFDPVTVDQPELTMVVPTGGESMPGGTYDNANVEVKILHFTQGATNYFVVTQTMPFIAHALMDGLNYIHVYKSPVSDPMAIEYASSTRLNQSSKIINALPLDVDASKFAIVYQGTGIDFISWNNATEGYVVTNNSAVNVAFIGVDQTGRVWANDDSNNSSLHMFGASVSSTIRVGFENKHIKYAGSVIDTHVNVSAFNYMGERILNNVTLQIDSNSATFADGSKVITISTSDSADTLVPIKIVSAGYLQVLASLAI